MMGTGGGNAVRIEVEGSETIYVLDTQVPE